MKSNQQSLADLKANPENPRTITDIQKAMLKKALAEFGDLGGLIVNRRTGLLVGGHQRLEAFREDGDHEIVISDRLTKPDKCGTVAHGYVVIFGSKHSYREVDWPKKKETAAMIAANQHGGSFDQEGLSELLKGLGEFDLSLTGFDADALLELGIGDAVPSDAITPGEAAKTLAERFGVPPFSVLDARQGYWQDRKRAWIALGIQSEIGRGQNLQGLSESNDEYRHNKNEFFSKLKLSPGGAPRPAMDYSKRQRGGGDGKPLK